MNTLRFLLVLALVTGCRNHPTPVGREAVRGLPPAADGPVLEGTIDASPALRDQVKAGDVIYVFAKLLDADGKPQRVPLAVDRLVVDTLPLHFRLAAGNVMMAGTPFAGAVVLVARDDRDGDAMTRVAGDLEGTIKATIPATGLKIVLDTPVAP